MLRSTFRAALHPTVGLVLTSFGFAQSFQFNLDSNASATNIGSSLRIELPATAIGDFDATNNPTGTSTCTNLFGTCNNTSFTMNVALIADATFAGGPSGGFSATIDTQNNFALISDLAVAALGKDPGVADLTLELFYPTFRTTQPNSLFVGGFTLPVPLGQASVDNILIRQTGAAVAGVLVPSGVFGGYTFTAVVPTELSFDLDVLGNQSTVGPVPLPLPLIGTLDTSGPQPVFTLFVDEKINQIVRDPLPGQTFEDFALDLPTLLPPGNVAHLLLDLTVGDLVFDALIDLQWVASGAPICQSSNYCTATPNTYSASGAQVMSIGSNAITFNDFTLMAHGVPPGHAGRFCMGNQQTAKPFGDGLLCVSGNFRRFPVVAADASGTAMYALDFTDPLSPSALIAAGSTWNFQIVFRDPIGGPLTFNTSDAVSVTFCP